MPRKKKPYKLSDAVIMRIVQILQEAMLVGTDITDLLRQLSIVPDETDSLVLVLTEEYEDMVRKWHSQLLERAEELKQQRETSLKSEN